METTYQKHVHWLDPAEHGDALAEMRRDKKRVTRAKHYACEALYPRREAVLVEPGVWDLACRRQGSWFRSSRRRSQSLFVTNHPLNEFPLWGTVTFAPFHPPRLAADEDVVQMTGHRCAREVLPEGWGLFSDWELQALHQYLASEGIDRSLQEVFSYYTANHLNFVFPRFFVPGSSSPVVPYSIQRTALVCSACVEIFGILGEEYPVKYLAPCPGLKYVNLAPTQYLRVTNECAG
jgi:hypothetical protein